MSSFQDLLLFISNKHSYYSIITYIIRINLKSVYLYFPSNLGRIAFWHSTLCLYSVRRKYHFNCSCVPLIIHIVILILTTWFLFNLCLDKSIL